MISPPTGPGPLLQVAIGVLAVVGALTMLASAVAMFRERDALARINVLSPATVLGLPLLVGAAWLHDVAVAGPSVGGIARLLVTVGALLFVSSVASNVLARAAYLSGAPVDPRTGPQDLAADPDGTDAADPAGTDATESDGTDAAES